MKRFRQLASAEDVHALALHWGILPFFAGSVPGFSIEERIAPRFWFPAEGEGIWEAKGPIIRAGGLVYGKLYRKKACFITESLYAHLRNWRRSRARLTPVERTLLELLSAECSLVSREWKSLAGFGTRRSTRIDLRIGPECFCETSDTEMRREGFDTAVANLQMAGYVLIEDFEYNRDKQGRPYGWGLARYTTPECLLGEAALEVTCSPQESAERLAACLRAIPVEMTECAIARFIG